jgi:photosystem II stability/assembly factor-like uncharacterized protein
MKVKVFSVLFLLTLLLSALACGFPFEIGFEGAPRQEKTAAQTSLPEEADQTLPLTLTTTAADANAPTEALAPAPDLPVFISPEIVSIQMFSPDGGWAAAEDFNRLLATQDGGATWLDVTPPDLLSLPNAAASLGLRPFFLDSETAWFSPSTVAANRLFYTQDGGVTWKATELPFERARYFFLNSEDGFALEDLGAGAGSHYVALHRTTDGGESWTEVFSHEPGEIKSLPEGGTKNGVTFISPDRGFIGGAIPMEDHFHFYVTDDGGITWAQETDLSLPGAFSGSFLDVWQPLFIDNTIGFLPIQAVGSGDGSSLLIFRSEDAGETWAFQGSMADGQDVDFIDAKRGWIAGRAGLFSTVDGGENWAPASTAGVPPGEEFLIVDFVDADHGWILAYLDEGPSPSRKLYRTADGGKSWTLLQP